MDRTRHFETVKFCQNTASALFYVRGYEKLRLNKLEQREFERISKYEIRMENNNREKAYENKRIYKKSNPNKELEQNVTSSWKKTEHFPFNQSGYELFVPVKKNEQE